MSSKAEEIELLDRVLFRLGCADTDEKLELTVSKFLTPVILKVSSPDENVRSKVLEVLTHIKRRLTSRPHVKIPVETLLERYTTFNDSPYLKNFGSIFISMGYPRLSIDEQSKLAPKLLTCEKKIESYQDKFLMLLIPHLGSIQLPNDISKRSSFLNLENEPIIRENFLSLLHDILLLPYGITQNQEIPPGMSPYSFQRVKSSDWKAEELENIKQGIVRFIASGVFKEKDTFILLLIASSDTRFSVATPAITELSKLHTILDFSNPKDTEPLYKLFSGNNSTNLERKTTPCCARVRQKLLQYLIKCRGRGIHPTRGIQVIFESLFGTNTNQKCRVLALQFSENLINDGPTELINNLANLLLTGINKVISQESNEPLDVRIAAYSAMAQLARKCPKIVNKDLKVVLSYFESLQTFPQELHSSIREVLIAMAPAFSWSNSLKNDGKAALSNLNSQHHLLLAMLSDSAESKLLVVQNVTTVFLTICFPDYYAPVRYLLLLMAGHRNSLYENISNILYGVAKKDNITYNMISSIEFQNEKHNNELNSKEQKEQKHITLPSFKIMMNHIDEMIVKRCAKNVYNTQKNELPYDLNTCEEILDYLRICLWYSAGIKSYPGNEKFQRQFREYFIKNYKNSKENELQQYLQFMQKYVGLKRTESNLLCLYDLLNAAPEIISDDMKYLLEPLDLSLKDVSETMRSNVAQIIGILLAYTFSDTEFNKKIDEYISEYSQKSLENKHGVLLVLGHAFNRKIQRFQESKTKINCSEWPQFENTIKLMIKTVCDAQWLIVSASIQSISLIGKVTKFYNIAVDRTILSEIKHENYKIIFDKDGPIPIKSVLFDVVFNIVCNTSIRSKIRELAAKCMGHLALGDGEYYTNRNLEKFLLLAKYQKDVALNIAIAEAIVSTLNGYNIYVGPPHENFINEHCDDNKFESFLNALIKLAYEPNPMIRQACSVWLLSITKHSHQRLVNLKKHLTLQFAFAELLSDDSEFVQDVASRGLSLVYRLSDLHNQNDLAQSLVDQLIGGKRNVNKVTENSEMFPEGMLGKTPCGTGNMTTYKELCSLASDLNKPEMIYQFMQLANHNASWTSKLGAAFGFKYLSREEKLKMQPYLGKIVPRLYRYKYDPTPKIQNSMISVWDSIVSDSKTVVEEFYWEILNEITKNLTCSEWRVRIACCLALRDLLKRPNGLRLRSDDNKLQNLNLSAKNETVGKDNIPEPELMELWSQLFRVMDDIHEGTRQAAAGSANILSKLSVAACSSDFGKSGYPVATSILPVLLNVGIIHTVPDIRNVSIKTITNMIDSSGSFIKPHLQKLLPCLLQATGELESTKLSYLSTRLASDNSAQEDVDTMRAELVKSNHTMDAITKCVNFIDYPVLEDITPKLIEFIKTSVIMGTKIATAHFICLVSLRLNKEITPVVSKYLTAFYLGLKDRNVTVRKYYANAIGYLIGSAKESSIKNLFKKLEELYMENSYNRSVAQTVVSINKLNHELLKNHSELIVPLIFFAMHEEQTEENKAHIELWKDLWTEISPGDSDISLNLNIIIQKLEKSMDDANWARKIQSANTIKTVAVRLSDTLPEAERLKLINLLLDGLQGRTFQGKHRLLEALAELCKNLDATNEICLRIIDSTMRECRKKEPTYRIEALASLGKILDLLEIDRFEEVYGMVWYLLEPKEIEKNSDDEDADKKDITTDERNKRVVVLNRLKEQVCQTLGQAWPKKSSETQKKFQILFAERCSLCLQNNVRAVQISLMSALTKFVDRLIIFENYATSCETENKEKKVKIDDEGQSSEIVKQLCSHILASVTFAAGIPHTGLKKESLNILLILIKRLQDVNDSTNLLFVKKVFDQNLEKYQKDFTPEVRCRVKDIEEKLSKI